MSNAQIHTEIDELSERRAELWRILGEAFDGTAQPGFLAAHERSSLPANFCRSLLSLGEMTA